MKSFTYTVKNPDGIHARPAGELIRIVSGFKSSAEIEGRGRKVNLKGGIFTLLGLGLRAGDSVTLSFNGEDEESAAKAAEEFLTTHL